MSASITLVRGGEGSLDDRVFSYDGVQESPLTYEVGGRTIRLFSDEYVHARSREFLLDSLDAQVESLLGLEPTRHLRGVEGLCAQSEVSSRLAITQEAYDRAISCARLMGVLYEPAPEVSMHLLRHSEAPEGLVSDVVPAMDQEVSPTHCSASSYLAPRYGVSGRSYAGWSHSHANMESFHSHTDDDNLSRLVRVAGLSVPCEEFDLAAWYVPSMVVNITGDDPFGVVGLRYYSYRDDEYRTLLREVPIKYSCESYGLCEVDLPRFLQEHVRARGCHERR